MTNYCQVEKRLEKFIITDIWFMFLTVRITYTSNFKCSRCGYHKILTKVSVSIATLTGILEVKGS